MPDSGDPASPAANRALPRRVRQPGQTHAKSYVVQRRGVGRETDERALQVTLRGEKLVISAVGILVAGPRLGGSRERRVSQETSEVIVRGREARGSDG
jgi:hypothetical protein